MEQPVNTAEPAPESRWVRIRNAYQTQVAKRADYSEHVAKFVPVFSVEGDGTVNATAEQVAPEEYSSRVGAGTIQLNSPESLLDQSGAAPVGAAGAGSGVVPHWLQVVAGWGWRLIVLAASIWLLSFLFGRLRMVFIALFVGLVLASVLKPLRSFFDRFMKRGLAVLCTMISGALIVAALLTYVIASVAHGWATVGAEFSNGVQQLIDLLRGPPLHLNIPYEHVGDAVVAGQTWIAGHYSDIAGRVMASAGTVTEAIATIALSVFLCVFFLASGRQMWQWLLSQFPQRIQHKLSIAFGTGFVTFESYARGQVIISLIDGIEAAILLTLLRIPLAIPLAVLVFIGSFIPMIGAPAAMLIAGVVALAADGPIKALIVIIGVALIGQIEAHLLDPFLMGHQVRLHPVVIALAVASGTMLGGILGAILAVPLVAVVWRVYQKLRPGADPNAVDPPPAKHRHWPRRHHQKRAAPAAI